MNTETKPRRFLRIRQVEDKVGLKKSRIYERMARGEFPRARKLSESTNVWFEHEIDAWMEQQPTSDPGIEPDGRGGPSGGSSGQVTDSHAA